MIKKKNILNYFKKDRTEYMAFERKLIFRCIQTLLMAAFFTFFIRFLVWGKLGDYIVEKLMDKYYLPIQNAMTIYQFTIRNNMEWIIILVMFFLVFVLFRVIVLGWLRREFNLIQGSMDQLIENPSQDIQLSPELRFMELKINTFKDMLEKKRMEARQAEQRKNDLVVYLAHDIKTPLTSVIGYLDLMYQVPEMPAEQRAKYMDIALEKTNRLELLINEFFEITRYNLQEIQLDPVEFNLSYMLMQMSDEFYPLLLPKKQTIEMNVQDQIYICGDVQKLARVFNNIIKNSIAYGYPDSVIQISLKVLDEQVLIQFKNGCNLIPQEKLEKLFEKFYRLDEARSSDTGNAGLGLAIAQKIITLHEGSLTAQSDENSVTFTVALPLKKTINAV